MAVISTGLKMNEKIKQFAEQAEEYAVRVATGDWEDGLAYQDLFNKKFAQLIVKECANICEEMAAKCAGLEGDGALAKDCAYWIKKDFGVEE